jgi:hypothetical protein
LPADDLLHARCGGPPPAAIASEASTARCLYWNNGKQYASINVQWAEIPEYALKALGPVEDYAGQPYERETLSWSGAPTTQAQLEERTLQALESGKVGITVDWYEYMLDDHALYPDPYVTNTSENHACDRSSGPTYENPGGNADRFAFHLATPFAITHRPPGHETTAIYLHKGTAHWSPSIDPSAEVTVDNWGGWGWRHIQAKHGWSQADLAETEFALTSAEPVFNPASGNWRYSVPVDPGKNGVPCTRNVVVDFEQNTEMGDPRPRGIVTSFNSVG